MAAYRRVYDSRHLQADCQEPGSASEPYASMGYLFIPVKARDYVFTGVGLFVCLSVFLFVCLFVCYHDN